MTSTIGRSLIRRNNKAFTFVELLVVVILLSVVSALAIPNFRNTYYNFLLTETSHNLTYLMRYAQASAIAERANYRLNFDTQYQKYWLTKKSEKDSFARIQGKLGRVFDLNKSISIEAKATVINFYPDGKIDKASMYLSNKNEKFYTITTEAQAGYVQEYDYKK
ncbi:MAG: prepilin-type N-terminal cleavage/methylation domain-containing protein [Candidatus Omnitrophica bacterium]|nr:prepilin-type N-terminal cleavage/methylation domain-containing protein [Candidatus Omnitrophota bacterium]HOX54029.1 prepilin-type N-terminal cleavage/methylation domain-containing protein [Candidatus Omnitrophota bacterium]